MRSIEKYVYQLWYRCEATTTNNQKWDRINQSDSIHKIPYRIHSIIITKSLVTSDKTNWFSSSRLRSNKLTPTQPKNFTKLHSSHINLKNSFNNLSTTWFPIRNWIFDEKNCSVIQTEMQCYYNFRKGRLPAKYESRTKIFQKNFKNSSIQTRSSSKKTIIKYVWAIISTVLDAKLNAESESAFKMPGHTCDGSKFRKKDRQATKKGYSW
jgi:hypothetical protein